MSLISGVDKEGPSGRVHSGHELGVDNIFQGELGEFIPMSIVGMLSE